MRTRLLGVAALLCVAVASVANAATLLGSYVQVEHDFPFLGSASQNFMGPAGSFIGTAPVVLVGSGWEAAYPHAYTVDIKNRGVLVTFLGDPVGFNFGGGITFNGLVLRGLNDLDHPDWVLLGISVKTQAAQFPAAPEAWSNNRIIFGNNWVAFDWEGLGWYAGQTFRARFNFGPPVSAVPEPATWAMMLIGFAGLGFAAYHRTRKPVLA